MDSKRLQQAAMMKLVQDLAETSPRLEINRVSDLRRLQSDMAECFDALPASKIRPSEIKHNEGTVAHSVKLWIPSSRSKIHRSLADAPLSSLGTQAHRARACIAEREIVQRLAFQGMFDRQSEVKEAHLATFEWIFASSEQRPSPVHFAEWLRDGDGIFWISGRPGSGKSTLMKYIYGDKRTMNLLSKWAGPSDLVPASFYFWSAGTSMQKSIQGLLQSLICQILRRCPALIQAAFPEEWRNLIEQDEGLTSHYVGPFDRTRLTKAIDSITRATDLKTKFCFFIDGLDEYKGYDRDIAAMISTLASSTSVKICVANRPHNVFVNSFGGISESMLYVHEYTDWDIRQYTKDVLEENPAFVSRKEHDAKGYQELVEYIRREANGVFLWVYLVVINILDGMENADRMSDLQRKLRKVPADLKALFKHILDSVNSDYHEQQAQMLLVACQADQPLNLIAYSFLDEDDPNFALNCRTKPMAMNMIFRRCQDMEKRVVARCKLLLEVIERPNEVAYFAQYVTFLHRTVRDYLQEAEAQNLLSSRLTGPFEARREICNALLAQIKAVPMSRPVYFETGGQGHVLVRQLLSQAKAIERLDNIPLVSHLNSLKSSLEDSFGREFRWWQRTRGCNSTVHFLALIISVGLSLYLESQLRTRTDEPCLDAVGKASLLRRILVPMVRGESKPSLDPNIVRVLLEHGADPNLDYMGSSGRSSWRMYLDALRTGVPESVDPDLDRQNLLVLEQLVLGGADLDYQNLVLFRTNKTVEQIVQRALSPQNAEYIVGLIGQQRLQNQQKQEDQQDQQNSGLRRWLRWR